MTARRTPSPTPCCRGEEGGRPLRAGTGQVSRSPPAVSPSAGGGGVHPALGPLSGGLRPCRKDARTPLPDLTAPVRPLPTWKPATHWGPWGSPWPLRLCGPAGASGHPFLGWGGPAGHPSCTTRLPPKQQCSFIFHFPGFSITADHQHCTGPRRTAQRFGVCAIFRATPPTSPAPPAPA